MFKLLRYIVNLKWQICQLEERVERLESRGRFNPSEVNPYDLGSCGGFKKKYIIR